MTQHCNLLKSSVEVNGVSNKSIDHVRIVSWQHFMNHKTKDTHHGGAAVVQFDSPLAFLLFGGECVPPKVDVIIPEVSDELPVSGNILHNGELQESNEEEDLEEASSGNFRESSDTSGDRSEGGTCEVDVPRETEASSRQNVSKDSKHGNTSVLDLDVSQSVEAVFIGICQKAQGVEKSEGRLGADFIFKGSEAGRGTRLLLCRSKSRCRGSKKRKNERLLHHCCSLF
mmetsp:Transcript_24947/g.71262  ORF Transcript_24947/g.71262 Transcript_24947/m.71262 type:complete len:228 (-) Transcript_24947:26-709(-)